MNLSHFVLVLSVLALIFGAIARAYVRQYSVRLAAAAGIYCCFLLLLAWVLAPGLHASRKTVQHWSRTPYVFLILWLAPYLLYCAGTGDFRSVALARLVIVSGFVVLIYRIFPVCDSNGFRWQDGVMGVWLILVVLSHALAGIWNVPRNLDFMGRLFLIAVASWSWLFLRRLPGLGYEFAISSKILRAAALNFIYFAAIAIPVSLALRFTAWNPRWPGVAAFCANFLEILLFIALLEELFFRGFLQNLLSRTFDSWKWAQLTAACLFGLFHILHAPFPNWRYVILASVAGWFYGSAYRSSGTIMASALLHAAVDTIWRTWLTKG